MNWLMKQNFWLPTVADAWVCLFTSYNQPSNFFELFAWTL